MNPVRGIRIHSVFLPKGQSIGFGQGIDVHNGEEVRFIGDWRPLYELGVDINEIARARANPDELPIVQVDDYQIVKVSGGIMPSLDEEVRPLYQAPLTAEELKYQTPVSDTTPDAQG